MISISKLTQEQIHPSHSIPTECKRHHCCSTVTGALRVDHPPLASVCLNSCWLQSRQEFLWTRMDLELFPSAWTSPRVAFSLPFTDDGRSLIRLVQEHSDHALTDPDLIAHLVVSHIRGSRLLPPPLVSHPTGARGNVWSVHLKVHTMHRAHGVMRVAFLIVGHVDLRQIAVQVALQLAQTPMKALCFWKQLSRHHLFCDRTLPRLRCTAEYKCPSFGEIFSCILPPPETSQSQGHIPALGGRVP